MTPEQIKVGGIYKVKKDCGVVCLTYNGVLDAAFVKFIGHNTFNILNSEKEKLKMCILCDLKPEHLEPLEKTLYTLEVGDEVANWAGVKYTILAVVGANENPLYFLSTHDNAKRYSLTLTAYQLNEHHYVCSGDSLITEMTVEEISKALGKEIRIIP